MGSSSSRTEVYTEKISEAILNFSTTADTEVSASMANTFDASDMTGSLVCGVLVSQDIKFGLSVYQDNKFDGELIQKITTAIENQVKTEHEAGATFTFDTDTTSKVTNIVRDSFVTNIKTDAFVKINQSMNNLVNFSGSENSVFTKIAVQQTVGALSKVVNTVSSSIVADLSNELDLELDVTTRQENAMANVMGDLSDAFTSLFTWSWQTVAIVAFIVLGVVLSIIIYTLKSGGGGASGTKKTSTWGNLFSAPKKPKVKIKLKGKGGGKKLKGGGKKLKGGKLKLKGRGRKK